MSFLNPSAAERFFSRHGSFLVYSKLSPEDQQFLGAPQFQVGQVVTVIDPWWWKHRVTGEQMRPMLKCVVTESRGYFHWRGTGGSYSLDVKDANNPGAHGRMISEKDVAGFIPNPNYAPA